ncbi:MAG: 3-dehydroquinate synthase [Bacteroidetes bacterium]|nr:MAG: 3-dehydroquinate synthase [Bacteroidota bacterium]
MKELTINGRHSVSKLLIGEALHNLTNYLPESRVMVIADSRVDKFYRHFYSQYPVIAAGEGEGIKNLTTVERIYEEMLDLEADRSWFVVGIGGGVVCDLAGYIASTYMRGLRFGFVSTSLLSQVDASLGGKNGINFKGYKNHIGTFNQPEFVICDTALLKTLPMKEVLSGFGEIVKHALIADESMFRFLEEHYHEAVNLQPDVIEYLVYTSAVIKSGVVNRDETEKGERRVLNFGHTLAHAIEKCSSQYTHGEAVGIGMAAATVVSLQQGRISGETAGRILSLLKNLGLPVKTDINKALLIDAMRHDKKRDDSEIDLVLLDGIGKCAIARSPLETTADLANAMDMIDSQGQILSFND